MKTKRLELKDWLKDSGKKIRILKALHKKYQQAGYETLTWSSENSKTYSENLSAFWKLRREYRHKHIAYSELRGHTRSEIENPREDNLPNEDWILSIKKEYSDEQETLRNSA